MRGADGLRDGDHDLERLGGGDLSAATRAEVLLEIFSGEELLHDEGRAVVVTRDVEHVDHVRMANRGCRPRLTEEAKDVVFVGGVLLVEELDRDLPTERHVRRAVDLAHAANAKTLLEQVLPAHEIALALALFFRGLPFHVDTGL